MLHTLWGKVSLAPIMVDSMELLRLANENASSMELLI